MNKKILIGAVAAGALLGAASLFVGGDTMLKVYVACSASFFGAAAVGGLLSYNSQEMRDFREIHREKSRMQLQKIQTLELELIERNKEILALDAKLRKQSSNSEAIDLVVISGVSCSQE